MKKNIYTSKSISLLTDFYEVTMANGYFENNLENKIVCFDAFFRKVPDNGGFAICAGLDQIIDFLEDLNFSEEDIEFLREQKIFTEPFLNYLKNFTFSCDVWAIKEGDPIFPGEPVLRVIGPVIEVQLIETMILLSLNHQSLIATKSNRMVRAAKKRPIFEFGARRAHGVDAAVNGARAAYIGGCAGTSCTLAGKFFDIPVCGTMAHSFVQLFDSELDAFNAYANLYPENCVLLIDTYDVINSGLKNAIKVFKENIIKRGYRPAGIRIDSGDLTYLAKKVRETLDREGLNDCKICVSNSLDEYIISDMIKDNVPIDSFGIGERLITASSDPVFGGVYKLSAVQNSENDFTPKIKISNNVSKITNPGVKKVWRIIDNASSKYVSDIITLEDEIIDDSKAYEIFDPQNPWKSKILKNFTAQELLIPIFKKGKKVYCSPKTSEIRDNCKKQVFKLWEEVKRFENPHEYYVDLSDKLWQEKRNLIFKYAKSKKVKELF